MKRLSLASALAFYLQSRRSLGFALQSTGALLGNLVRYSRKAHHHGPLTTELAIAGAEAAPPASAQRAHRLAVVRQFARFWAAFDPRTQIPPAGLFGPGYRRRPVHIYTPAQIGALRARAQQLSSAHSMRADTLSTLLGLLACTGLRISEALRSRLVDWDPAEAVLTVRRSKSGQSRCVPLAPTAARALQGYLQARQKAFPKAKTDALFLNQWGQPLTYGLVHRAFGTLCDQLHWQQRPKPRLHDLRHTFAVNCLLSWYRTGQEELNAKVLSLAVYLGHRDIRHTYWYLSAVPELLALAVARGDQTLTPEKGAARE